MISDNESKGILSRISGPEDIKKLSMEELVALCCEIREFLINTVSKTGGHIASNLGVVELTLAIHRVFDTPRDKIVWDVGHQTYVHKILTGRKDRFGTLRQLGGISGFPKTEESIYDTFNTGHSSTSISAALGLARARDMKGENYSVAAVIGDGALTGGMAFEALNDAGNSKTNILVILNDNGMSIAPNVGGLSRYLSRIRTRPFYYKTRESIQSLIDTKLPKTGKRVRKTLHRLKATLKSIFVPSMFFEDLGFRYFGPIDGHDLKELITVLEHVRTMKGPILVHVCTVKGKGYRFAEEKPSIFHGIAPFEVETGELKSSGGESYSQVFGRKICELAARNRSIAAITAAMPDGTGLNPFKAAYPRRFFDVGIAEQHAVTFAAGLARGGMIPVVAIYSTFLQRAYDQMLHDVALQNLHVVFAIDRAGIVGEDGETHQGIYDIAYIRTMPNFTLMAPASPLELEMMLEYAVLKHKGPIAIRYPRGAGHETDGLQHPVKYGKGLVVRPGNDITIIAVGNFLPAAVKTAELLEDEGLSCEIINPRFIKPLDKTLLRQSMEKTGRVVVMEDGIASGGFGSIVLEFINEEQISARALLLGFPDEPIPHGSREEIYMKYGLDPASMRERILDFFGVASKQGGRIWVRNVLM